jgi:hypothetical protein
MKESKGDREKWKEVETLISIEKNGKNRDGKSMIAYESYKLVGNPCEIFSSHTDMC